MKTFRIIGFVIFAILLCVSACSEGGDEPIEPTPKPEVVKSEITIDPNLISNGLSFSYEKGERSISFSTNENWTLSIANTTSGVTLELQPKHSRLLKNVKRLSLSLQINMRSIKREVLLTLK